MVGLLLLLGLAPLRAQENTGALTLKACLEIARREHPLIQSAQKQVETQAALVVAARADYFPQVSISGTADRTDNSPVALFPSPYQTTQSGAVQGQVSLYDFGRTGGRVDAARMDMSASRYELDSTAAQVDLAVKTAFFEVLRAEAKAEIIAASVRSRMKWLALTRRAYERGTRSLFDVSRGETDLESERLDRVSAEAAGESAHRQLLAALGTPDAPWRAISGSLDEQATAPPEDQAVRGALHLRPEIKAGNSRVGAAEDRERVASDENLPSFFADASYSPAYQTAPFATHYNGWLVEAGASLKIFSGFAIQAQTRAARAQKEKLRQDLEAANITISLQVRQALISLREAQSRIEASRRLLQSARKSFELAAARYERGVGNSFDLIDAQNQELRARLNQVDSLADSQAAKARLERAIGASLEDVGGR